LIAAHERVAEVVERRSPAHQRLLKRGERLGDAHQHRLVLVRHRAEHFAVAARQIRIPAHKRGHARGIEPHLVGIEQRPDALRPQAVVRAVPAEPALHAHVRHAQGVPVGEREPARAREAVGPVALRDVAARARHLAVRGEPPLEEQPLTELDGVLLPRRAIRGVGCERRRPGPVRLDHAALGRCERQRG
jgi:hypothetical protein